MKRQFLRCSGVASSKRGNQASGALSLATIRKYHVQRLGRHLHIGRGGVELNGQSGHSMPP